MIYLIGSLRNPRVPDIAADLRGEGFEVFDDWYAAGPEADDKWQEYEEARGRDYSAALKGAHAQCVFDFDTQYLEQAHTVILALPAGKSGHLELGWALGRGKKGYILLDGEATERFDIMYRFATGVYFDLKDLKQELGRRGSDAQGVHLRTDDRHPEL